MHGFWMADLLEYVGYSKTLPVLFYFSKDYLARSPSSCAAEKTFSSAADVLLQWCGSLKPQCGVPFAIKLQNHIAQVF
ncbi:hypothetical protein VP01_609g5 [Puccinia sorghi]|uniref:HAT C-terminal dimerisation domain-containing protein n=1 Tax=Puccinia sorghi TaxID=27349 RepID=A0A0L6UHX6_9BASI|nr:hypothetical protein VP01_609g5 [Puccinia sorghi]